MSGNTKLVKTMIPISYLMMVTVNALANILPINNLTTGAVSDSYPNLFAPAGITFSIWGVIYLLLGAYSVYQLMTKKVNSKLFFPVNSLFIATSIVNSVWIFAWHYQMIWLTVILMLILLGLLIKIADVVNKEEMDLKEKLIYKIPFGVYFGWITVATIANITTFLVDIGWNGFGLTDTTWMIIILITGAGIAIWRMHKDNNIAYGLVPVWAYFGIWYKHTSSSGFDSAHPTVINAVLICLAFLAISNVVLGVRIKETRQDNG